MLHRLFALLIVLALASQASLAEPPNRLAWGDLVDRPDRYPATCRLTEEIRLDTGKTLRRGSRVHVLGVTRNTVKLQAGGRTLELPADKVDLLVAANREWRKLSPEQRALTVEDAIADRSLWPAEVKLSNGRTFNGIRVEAGATRPMLSIVQGNLVGVQLDGLDGPAAWPMGETDFFARCRDMIETPKQERPNRMAGIFGEALVDVEGDEVDLEPAELYVFYWTGSECTWSDRYNPSFVEYHQSTLAGRDDVQVIGVPSALDSMPAYLTYAKRSGYDWPILPHEHGVLIRALGDLGAVQFPGVLVVDKHGTLIASTLQQQGDPAESAGKVVEQLDQQLVADAE